MGCVIMAYTAEGGEIPGGGDLAEQFFDARVAVLQSIEALPEDKELAFGSIVDEFSVQLRGIARKIVKNPSDVEEVVQETFLRVWRGIDTYRPIGAFRSWVLQIGYNQSINRYRSLKPK